MLVLVISLSSCNFNLNFDADSNSPTGDVSGEENSSGGGENDDGENTGGSTDNNAGNTDNNENGGDAGGNDNNENGENNENGGNAGGNDNNESGENNENGGNAGSGSGDGNEQPDPDENHPLEVPALTAPTFDLSLVPEYTGDAYYVEINGNVPTFEKYQYTETSYEYYSELDSLGRCGVTVACIGRDIMPTEGRGSISSVYPTGWNVFTNEDGTTSNFYERSHLIGFQLTGENANKKNLISGTYALNGEMQKVEDMVADYIKETGNHVLYRVTPVFEGDNLLASGVHMEAYSVEDEGDGVSFNIYIYNAQKDYDIDYKTGEMEVSDDADINNCTYVINTRNNKFHSPTCSGVRDMSEKNKEYTKKTREELIEEGYTPCGSCKP